MLQEFREFIAKGNVLDLAVGVIIGGAFSKIVDSLVKDLITPLLSPLTNKVNFAEYSVKVGAFGPFGVGNFVNAVIQFLIVAFALFLLVKTANRLRRETESKTAEKPAAPDLAQQNVEQNKEIIALLRSIAGKENA